MRKTLSILFGCCALALAAFGGEPHKTFEWPTELKYEFMPKCEIELVDGVVKNTDATALPDIDEKYARTVRVDGIRFTLPGEICEKFVACYRTDFNGDNVPDYVFVHVKVWNGRFMGRSDVAVYVSTPEGTRNCVCLEVQDLEAVVEDGKPMLVKYDWSDDEVTMLRQVYKFDAKGRIRLHRADAVPVWD